MTLCFRSPVFNLGERIGKAGSPTFLLGHKKELGSLRLRDHWLHLSVLYLSVSFPVNSEELTEK